MAVALVLNGIPDLQLSMEKGLEALGILLADRQNGGCTVTPSGQIAFGIQYRIEHPSHGIETVYLTYYQEATDALEPGT
jgi:hypothetical protein